MRIVIIIPTYNEVKNIGRMLDILVEQELPQIKTHDVQILVVDSKSPDGTAEIVKEKMQRYKNVKLLSVDRGGLGADYVKGFKYATKELKADAVVEMDSDFQHDPKDVKRLIEAMDKGADYVIGSRYISGGAIPPEWSLDRKLMSFFGSLFARIVLFAFEIHDMTSGFKLTKIKFLEKVNLDNLYSKYYAYKIQILYEVFKKGAKVVEVPIVFHERAEGTSKISSKDLIDSFIVVVKLRLRDSKNFVKFAIVGAIGFLINYVGLEILAGTPVANNLAGSFAQFEGQIGLGVLAESSAWAAGMAGEVAIMSNFTFNNFWTFKEKRITNPFRFVWKFLQFNLTSFGAILIQFFVVGFAVLSFGDTNIVRLVALVVAVVFLIVPYNYTMYNVFIWKRWKVPGLGWLQNTKGLFVE